MPNLPPISDAERADLRRLYGSIPRGCRHVSKHWNRDEVYAGGPGERLWERRVTIAACAKADAAEFISYAHNVLRRTESLLDASAFR